MNLSNIPVVILCGGKGLRLSGQGQAVPKALVEVGGRPILWHVMKLYSRYGCNRFILCLGHLGNVIKEFFLEGRHWRMGDVTINIGFKNDDVVAHSAERGWQITFADTGELTNTGGRIKRVRPYIEAERFFATYVDGLSDVNLKSVLDFHEKHGRIGTLTSVNPTSSFGVLGMDKTGKVQSFSEKPRMDMWINGGFFVFQNEIFEHLTDNGDLERDTLASLAGTGNLMAYRHAGFWTCMDTYKDTLNLNQLWDSGEAPWRAPEDSDARRGKVVPRNRSEPGELRR